MSASLNQLPSQTKVKPVILITIALLMVAVVSYLILLKPSKERLLKNLNSQIREEKFAQLYDEADKTVHLKVTKEKFVQRMKIARTKLKAVDENLNFQRDSVRESIFLDDESVLIMAVQTLEKDGKSVAVYFAWATDTGKFVNLWVTPTEGTSKEYEVSDILN